MRSRFPIAIALLTILGAGILPALAATAAKSAATPASMPVAQKINPDIAEGKQLMETHCSRCHALPAPDSHTLNEWPAILNQMAPRAHLLPADQAKIEAYIRASLQAQ